MNHSWTPDEVTPERDRIAIFRIEADFVTDVLKLQIIADSAHHANLIGMPRPSEDQATADSIARQLAMHAAFVMFRPRRR